jgi:o-succinylbenzoate---CoA ligase
VINSGGIKLHPLAIEEKISPLVHHRICVSSIEDETFGEIPVLVIESDIFTEVSIQDLLVRVNSGLTRFTKIRQVKFLKKFPETENGKVNRREIKKCINETQSIL